MVSGRWHYSKLLDLLKDYGDARVSGSYRLNLMTTGDVDIHVINPKITKERVKEALDRLIEQDFFDGYHFHDRVSHFGTARVAQGDDPLKGYYIALKTVFRGRRWKIDVWFLRKPHLSERGGVKIDFKFFADPIDRPNQIYKDRLVAYVDDHGKKLQFEKVDIVRVVFPQEFLLLVGKSGVFEFIGWWNNWHLHEPLETAKRIERPITIIRRT